MNVSFKGVKNVGYIISNVNAIISAQTPDGTKQEEPVVFKSKIMNMHFTDDFNGKHLSEYKSLLKKHPEFKNPIVDKALNFMVLTKNNQTVFVLNNTTLPINDKHLDLISFLAKNLKNITQKQEKDFVVNKDYFLSEDFSKGILLGQDLFKDASDEAIIEFGKLTHNPKDAKKGAKDLLKEISETMFKYFE